MQKQVYVQADDKRKRLNYLISFPSDPPQKGLPLIVFLHGAGERGSDLTILRAHSIPKIFEKDSPVNAITLCPQIPDQDRVWSDYLSELKDLIDETAKTYEADLSRISLTGVSMGGFGVWDLAFRYPHTFSRLAPVCGGGMAWRVPALKHIPVRAFHGDRDDVVNPAYSSDMVDALTRCGGTASLTIFHNTGHDSWNKAYGETNLLSWLIE